jgi:16S rRNA processing protein RimM
VSPPADLVELGAVRGAYGVKGLARVQPFDADAVVLRSAKRWWLQYKGNVDPLEVSSVRRHGDVLLAKWQGWDTPESIDAVKGAVVAVPRSEFPVLPAGQHYWSDLIGAQVVNREGQALGTVSGLANNGAHDVLQIEGESGTLLVPLVPAYVDDVDVAARVIRVDWQVDWL